MCRTTPPGEDEPWAYVTTAFAGAGQSHHHSEVGSHSWTTATTYQQAVRFSVPICQQCRSRHERRRFELLFRVGFAVLCIGGVYLGLYSKSLLVQVYFLSLEILAIARVVASVRSGARLAPLTAPGGALEKHVREYVRVVFGGGVLFAVGRCPRLEAARIDLSDPTAYPECVGQFELEGFTSMD